MAGVGTVTLLFTDLVGSTALASSLGDVEVDRIRRAHFATLRAAIASTGGDEVKNLGDGLLVAYRSASDAVEGAVAMQRAVDRANADATIAVSIKIGISVGDVTEDDGDWFGMPVNEAARLCAAADGGQILASDVVRLLAGSRARHAMRPAGTRELKGLSEPLAVCEVEWTRVRESLDLPLPPGFVVGREIVGRDAELALVLGIWRGARQGTAATVLIGGEPGIGKTRLAAAVAAAAHADGALVLVGRCDEDLAAPYRPWIEALRYVLLGVAPETIRDWAGVRTRELVRVVPELSARIGGLEPPTAGDPESERFALFEAVTALLTGAAAAKPLLVVLDDLQWCDTASLLLWRHVMRNAAAGHMMVVGTYRDAEVEEGSTLAQVTLDMKRTGTFERVILGGLDDNSTAALLTAWAGRPIPATFARAVHEETDGNPFFVEEVLGHLVDRGSVRRADDGWEVPAALGDLAAPDGVRELVRRRATALTEGAQRLLAVAALMGREFDLDIVADVADVKEDEVLDAFEEAASVGLVAEIPDAVGRYRFGHALIRLALEESISAARRARLHLRIGEVLEHRQSDDVTALAHHFIAAANAGLAKAVEYALGAARAALAGLAYEEAARYAEQGLRALELVDDAEPYARVDLLLLLAEARTDLTEVDAAHRAAVAAADEARRLDDTPRFVRAVFLYGLSGGLEIDTVRNALVDEALDRLDEGDSSERAILMSAQAAWSMIVSPTPNDNASARAALDMARRVSAPRAIAYCAAVVGDLLIGSPQPRERIDLLIEALAAAETSGLMRGEFNSLQWSPSAFLELGDRTGCEAITADLEARARALHLEHELVVLPGVRCMLAMLDGDFDTADRRGAEAEALTSADSPYKVIGRFAQRVSIARERGEFDELLGPLDAFTMVPDLAGLRGEVGCWYLGVGRRDDARAVLDTFAEHSFTTVPHNWGRSAAIADLSELATEFDDAEAAAALLPLVDEYRGLLLVAYGVVVCRGAADRVRGQLLAVLGRYDEALAALDAAEALEASVNGRSLLPRTWTARGRALARRDAPGDRDAADALYAAALAEAQALGMKDLAARVTQLRST